jgi:3-oxoacyl-[acyl-carrier protein] reductase
MKLSYENRVAIVTGAGSGIGRAACLQLAQEGAKIAAIDINAEHVEKVVAEINAAGGTALALACDISNEEQVKAAVARTVSELGAPYALFNIAGIVKYSRVEKLDLATFNRIMQVNLVGAFLMSQATLPHLVQTRGAICHRWPANSACRTQWLMPHQKAR